MIAVPHAITPADYLSLEHQNPIRHEYRQRSPTQPFTRQDWVTQLLSASRFPSPHLGNPTHALAQKPLDHVEEV